VATSLEDSTEAGIRLALGMEEVDHRTADVGLASLAAEFSLPTAAAAATGVRREAEEEVVVERGNGFGVSAREALAVAAFTPLLLPPPPPRSLRREAMAGARVWGSSEMTRRNGGWFGLVRGMDLAGCS
jgi:hypothetical protein